MDGFFLILIMFGAFMIIGDMMKTKRLRIECETLVDTYKKMLENQALISVELESILHSFQMDRDKFLAVQTLGEYIDKESYIRTRLERAKNIEKLEYSKGENK